MRVLVLGASGQLARHLGEELPEAVLWGRSALDLASDAVFDRIEAFAPSVIVNAAAYTAVDKAEAERSAAWAVNAAAPAALAEVATALAVPLVHVSTDYVFDGRKTGAYEVDDPVHPTSVYGATKLAGEIAVQTLCPRSWILRTSWVFSEHGHNFVRTMLRLAATRESLRVVADQVGRPTYAKDIARCIARLVGAEPGNPAPAFGLYHAVGGPVVSWHEFAAEIVGRAYALQVLEKPTPIEAISTSEYPTAAKRPMNSALRPSGDFLAALGCRFDWRDELDTVIRKIGRS